MRAGTASEIENGFDPNAKVTLDFGKKMMIRCIERSADVVPIGG
jgi:hypothetical protein